MNFRLFGPAHLAILAAIVLAAAGLARWSRASATAPRRIRLALGGFLLANEAVWWTYRIHGEGLRSSALPLQLSDFTLWMTIAALLTLARWTYEVAYYAGLASAAMAVLTPDLWAPFPSYPTLYFFLGHGGAIVAVAALTWGGVLRPEPGSLWRAFLILNAWAAAVGVFNAAFGTNYMYLARKPANPSALDWLGPWPVYILTCECLALAGFWVLWRLRPKSYS
jgi:hypothetical integral membrane protein (TIGR02206 family)